MIRHLLINQGNVDKTAIIENDREISYAALIHKACSLQPLLPQMKRENVAIFLPNSSDYIAAVWGTMGAGMTGFPLHVFMTEHEIAPLLKHAGVKTVVTSWAYRVFFEHMAAHQSLSLKIIYMEELDKMPRISEAKPVDVNPDEPMVLLSTSGTTGTCKIVQLSERNVEASVLGYLDRLHLEETTSNEIRFNIAVPFSSVYGMMALSACLIQSFPIVLVEQPFTLDSLFKAAEKHKITHYEGSTSAILLMEQMIGKPIPYDISALTYFGFGGSKVFGSTIERLYSTYAGKDFLQGYGMTETASLISKHPRGNVAKTESVGIVINGMDIAIEADEGITCAPYVKGEIIVRGANVMLGYYKNEQETKRVLKNGYLYTGDIGYLDEEGYLCICGRIKNIIIVRGFNVYPEEVEECIQNSRLAKDCLVYGQTDAFGNERVCADVVPIDPQVQAEALFMYCSGHLATYKQPKKITFCESIKRNVSGKVERRNGDFA